MPRLFLQSYLTAVRDTGDIRTLIDVKGKLLVVCTVITQWETEKRSVGSLVKANGMLGEIKF